VKIDLICSDPEHPIYPRLLAWMEARRGEHSFHLVNQSADLDERGGDFLFLVSCHEHVPVQVRQRYRYCLLIHASNLPKGRGWSPWVWQILEGSNTLTLSLLEAADAIDSGPIWHQISIDLQGHELADEIQDRLIAGHFALVEHALAHWQEIKPRPQEGQPTYYRRRTPEDSRLDVHRSIAEQFELLRVADSRRYPAFFDYRGHRFQIFLKKVSQHEH